MRALGAFAAWFVLIGLTAALVDALIQRPGYALAMAVIGLLAWAYARWTRVEAPQKPGERPQRPIETVPRPTPEELQLQREWADLEARAAIPGDEIEMVSEYVENVKRAHRIGGRKPKPAKRKPLVWNPARVKTEAVASRPVRPEDVPPTHPMRIWFEQAGLNWPPS